VTPRQRIVRVFVPERSKHTTLFGGPAAEAARDLVRALRDDAHAL